MGSDELPTSVCVRVCACVCVCVCVCVYVGEVSWVGLAATPSHTKKQVELVTDLATSEPEHPVALAALLHGGCCLLVLVAANGQAPGPGIIQWLISVSQLFTIKCSQLPMSVSWCLPGSGTGFTGTLKNKQTKNKTIFQRVFGL